MGSGRLFIKIVALVALSLCETSVPGQTNRLRSPKHSVRILIMRLDQEFVAALVANDPTTLAGILADDFLVIHSDGTVRNKSEWLSEFASVRRYVSSQIDGD